MPQTAATTLGTLAATPAADKLVCHDLQHLPHVENRFYCPQAFQNLDFRFRTDVLDLE